MQEHVEHFQDMIETNSELTAMERPSVRWSKR